MGKLLAIATLQTLAFLAALPFALAGLLLRLVRDVAGWGPELADAVGMALLKVGGF